MLALAPALPMNAAAQTAHFSYGEVTLPSNFSIPIGVAVDGSGNVFVADYQHNAVKEIPSGCATYSCILTLGSGFNGPNGVAVDGSGNLFVADTNNGAVKELLASGGFTTINTLGGGFYQPTGIAIDANGNVFVADQGSVYHPVTEIPSGCTSASCVVTLGSTPLSFNRVIAIAVDGSDNVYVADFNNNAVKEMLASTGYTQVNTLASGFSFNGPEGVALDGNGNVYVADCNNNAAEEILAAGGYTTVNTLLSGLSGPGGVAVDGSGNIFISDSGYSQVLELEAKQVNFGTVAIGQASATIPLIFTFDSGGTIGSPVALTQGAAGMDFADAGTGTCTTNGTSYAYSAGNTCTVNVTFTPRVAGLRNGAVLLQNGSGNTIATGYVYGVGSGPQVSFLPGSQITLGGGFGIPMGVAVDGSGNAFVADYRNNAVKEIPYGCVTTSCVKTLGNGFYQPSGVALDASGNVYVADSGNSAVKEILASGGYSTINTLGGGFYQPTGVALDASGNVFVADQFSVYHPVTEIPSGCTSASCVVTLGSAPLSFNRVIGIAVDGTDNVYVADFNNNAVKEMLASTGYTTVNTLATGFSFNGPQGVALDQNGNVYVADCNNNMVEEILAAGGYTTVNTLASGLYAPGGVVVDGSGNVYFADYFLVAKLDYADPPTLSFATPTPVGSTDTTDGPQTVTIQNIGNASLIFQPFVAGNLLDAVLSPLGATDCTELSGLQLAPGTSCTLGIEFAPAQSGSVSGHANLVDNALNASPSTQTIVVQGTGALATPTVSFTGAPASAPFGSAFYVVATTNASTTAVITESGACSGSAPVIMISGTGTCMLTASWAADSNYFAASLSQSTAATLAGTASTIISSTPNPSTAGKVPVTVSFSIASLSQIPLKGVFSSGSVTVTASTGESCNGGLAEGGGSCGLIFTTTGSRTLTATYSGDTNFAGSSSAGVSQVVLVAGGADLIESSVSVLTTAPISGGSLVVSDTVTNQGSANAGASTTGFYLSTNGTSKGTILGTRSVPALASGNSSGPVSTTLTLPLNLYGNYYLMACANYNNAVVETNTANNCTSSLMPVAGADFIESYYSGPASAASGGTIQVTDTTTNQGPGNAGGSNTGFYLSTNGTSKGTLLGSRSVPALAAGNSSGPVTTTLTLPLNLSGNYYIMACANYNNQVVESSTTNDCTSLLALPVAAADFIESYYSGPASASSGGTIQVTDTTTNQGGGNAAASSTGFYLSTNGTSKGPLLGSRNVPALAAGNSSGPVSTTLTLPLNLNGNYYLMACANYNNQDTESTTANNCITSSILPVAGADLIESPVSGASGGTIQVTDTVVNQGNGNAGTSVTGFYLSSNGTVKNTLLGTRSVPALAAGASSGPVNTNLTLPTNLNGNYYIMACANYNNTVVESNITNNCTATGPIAVH